MRRGEGGTWVSNPCLLEKVTIIDPKGTIHLARLQRPVSHIVVSVTQGAVDIWFGEMGSGLPLAPDMHFGQTNKPEWVPIPAGNYTFTVKASGDVNPNLATVFFWG